MRWYTMASASSTDRFGQQGARSYDGRIVARVPGYDALHRISGAVLAARLGEAARVLVVGAGTGTESLALGRAHPLWRVVGVDPSPEMLAVARERARAQGLTNVEFVDGTVAQLPADASFDAALVLLVMHFVPDHAGKTEFLTDIASRLSPAAPLLLGDLMDFDCDDLDAMSAYAADYGVPEHEQTEIREKLRTDFYPLTDAQLESVAAAAGFGAPHEYFRGLAFVGTELRRG